MFSTASPPGGSQGRGDAGGATEGHVGCVEGLHVPPGPGCPGSWRRWWGNGEAKLDASRACTFQPDRPPAQLRGHPGRRARHPGCGDGLFLGADNGYEPLQPNANQAGVRGPILIYRHVYRDPFGADRHVYRDPFGADRHVYIALYSWNAEIDALDHRTSGAGLAGLCATRVISCERMSAHRPLGGPPCASFAPKPFGRSGSHPLPSRGYGRPLCGAKRTRGSLGQGSCSGSGTLLPIQGLLGGQGGVPPSVQRDLAAALRAGDAPAPRHDQHLVPAQQHPDAPQAGGGSRGPHV